MRGLEEEVVIFIADESVPENCVFIPWHIRVKCRLEIFSKVRVTSRPLIPVKRASKNVSIFLRPMVFCLQAKDFVAEDNEKQISGENIFKNTDPPKLDDNNNAAAIRLAAKLSNIYSHDEEDVVNSFWTSVNARKIHCESARKRIYT